MPKKITVVDYGAGNIGSVLNMIKRVGGVASASGNVEVLAQASKLLLPGVGSFDNAVQKLEQLGLDNVLRERAGAGVPLLGICLGMQLLSSGSEEGILPGLGLIPGRVKHFSFDADQSSLKIPHMGWNEAIFKESGRLTEGIKVEGEPFYFVHSYRLVKTDESLVWCETDYAGRFVSGIKRGKVLATQFHPEKSQVKGLQIYRNFLTLVNR